MTKTTLLFFLPMVLLLSSCGGEPEKRTIKLEAADTLEQHDEVSEDLFQEARKIYFSMPSPLELTTLLQNAGGEFRKDLPLNPKHGSSYQSVLQQSMVLGVYGADLSYSSVYEQQQESLIYLAAAKRLAGEIGIHDAFSHNRIERANTNMNNKDSMMVILAEVYWEINGQLKDENRNEIAMLVMCAGWVEGLYLGCELAEPGVGDGLMIQRMMEQKFTAMQIRDMFNTYSDMDLLAQSLPFFEPLLSYFEGLDVKEEPAEMNEAADGSYVIGGAKDVQYTDEDFLALKEITIESRSKMVAL